MVSPFLQKITHHLVTLFQREPSTTLDPNTNIIKKNIMMKKKLTVFGPVYSTLENSEK